MDLGSYELRVEPSIRRSLDRIPERYALAVVVFMREALTSDPWRRGKALRGELRGRRVARIDAYRIVYRVDEDSHIVTVTRIEHRADVYRPR